MDKITTAFQKFQFTSKRAITLAGTAVTFRSMTDEKKLLKGQYFLTDLAIISDDIYRSAIVMVVAGMDEYFTDRYVELLLPFLKSPSRKNDDFYELLTQAGLDIKEALNLLAMQRPNKRIKTLVKHHLERFTTQNTDRIDTLFGSYGIKDFSHHVARMAQKRHMLSNVRTLVKRRHSIVHEGDYDEHRRLRKINKKQLLNYFHNIILFVFYSEQFLVKFSSKWQ